MNGLAVETHGLRKRFGATLAVADLSLSVRRGEVFGFLGPNGAGKTTSLKMLLGLVSPSAGRVSVLGARLGDREARARVGFLPEHFRFQDWLTGRELLRFHGRLFGIPAAELERRADRLLTRVDLADAAHRKLREYSKGMVQRIGLAQALINDPDLVFLDEPTSGLDPLGRRLVRDVIKELKARGTAVFLNSHLLGEVEATCDRVVFIQRGRTIREMALGTDAAVIEVELRLGPHDGATLAALARIAVAAPAPAADGRTVRLTVAGEDALSAIAPLLVERGVTLYEMRAGRPSLEALFLEIMGEGQRPG
ncbi:MAG: ABC transporter ATP-binding protein [Candidatus Eisenbacteria bacterium]|uniref:ABC transporter ATP-binding protein n=1 Tax=Eiseniibacteriota bacterium TaxID=2212470 RepID=A0A9D6L7J0_UNCEI|nr:ABC transporter ATP-binding protein [Candidatus Eisenbacteria bacterium]MBI3539040.1 ABC transporter ATP-binding protein [Candidatus Eisenbacteria bacterium]